MRRREARVASDSSQAIEACSALGIRGLYRGERRQADLEFGNHFGADSRQFKISKFRKAATSARGRRAAGAFNAAAASMVHASIPAERAAGVRSMILRPNRLATSSTSA